MPDLPVPPEGYCGWREFINSQREKLLEDLGADKISKKTFELLSANLGLAEARFHSIDHGVYSQRFAPLRKSEVMAYMQFLLRLVGSERDKNFQRIHILLELEEDARKKVVMLLLLLPTIEALAKAASKHVYYLTPTFDRARNAHSEMQNLFIPSRATFTTWHEAWAYNNSKLRNSWVLGDVDSAQQEVRDGMNSATHSLTGSSQSSAVFVHQKGSQAAFNVAVAMEAGKKAGSSGCGCLVALTVSAASALALGCML